MPSTVYVASPRLGLLKDPYEVVEYGEKLGLGTRAYELVDVMPVEQISRAPLGYINLRTN